MNVLNLNVPMIKRLVVKDWQLFEKQLAAYVVAGIGALCFLGLASSWSFYVGSLLLIIVMVAAACFSISTSLLVERKEQTMAFIMSLPVSSLDFYIAKLVGNLITFLVPFLIMALGSIGVIVYSPLPDGLVLLAVLVFGHIACAYCLSLSVAMAVESEGWNTFVMIASMVLINPFLMLIGQIPAIQSHFETENIVWSWQALAILGAQAVLGVGMILFSAWKHGRKRSFY